MAKKSFSFKAKHKSKKGGLTEAGRKAHNRATGSNLKRPQPEGGSRKKSYCARSKGQMNDHNIDCSKTPDKRICLARRRWKCNKSLQKSDVTPKQKLAMFLREHLDNKLALKAAEPTITKSNMPYSESLEKGARGDWEKEGHVLSHTIEDDGAVIVEARHPKYGVSGKAVLTPEVNHDGKTVYYPGWVGTEAWARRKGLATAMLNHAKQNGFELSNTIDLSSDGRALAEAYKQKFGKSTLKKDLLPGGKGDTKNISDFDAKEVEMGMKVELEHTKDINIAKEIVTDHLSEDPSYYSKLKGSGLADELKKGLKGDWEKEGYKLVYEKDPNTEEFHYVTAYTPDNKIAGNYFFVHHGKGMGIFPYESSTEKKHRRKGLATAAYKFIENKLNEKLGPSPDQSKDAKKLWKQPNRPFGEDDEDELELNKAGRCWEGYEPTPSKKPYSKGSCRKIKKSELNKSDVSLHLINQFEGSPTSPTEHHYSVKHKGQEVGRAIVFDKDPKSIHNAGKIGPSLKDIRINPEHQGKGLSGQIINKLVETHGPLASDSRGNISEAGDKMFNKYGTKQLDNSYVLSGGKMQKSYHQKLVKALKCKCQEKELKKSISAMAIESGEYQGEPLDSHHHNRIGNEYRGMAKQAHKEGNKSKAREYHEKALMHFRKADEMGFQQEEPLEKKISSKLIGAGLAAAAALAPATPSKDSVKPTSSITETTKPIIPETPKVTPPIDASQYVTVSPEASQRLGKLFFGKNPEDKFLHNIMQAESTGGKDINHPPITNKKSMHYGTTAFGYWALMPLTVQETAGRYARQGGKDPRILKIPQMSKHDVNDWLAKNPDVELEIARTLARHVTSRFGNTPKAAYAWKYGHNKKDISEEEALKDTYIQKFKDLNEGKLTDLTRGLIPASKAFSGLK